MTNPLVSVVIPCYNHQDFVQDSIQSVIDQTYQNIELIIIDDGSKDDSVAKIEQMIEACEQRFTRFEFRSRPNKGLSATLNEAIERCQGKYFAALASDDMVLPHKTATQVEFLEAHPEISAVFAGAKLIDDSDEMFEVTLREPGIYSFKQIIMNKYDFPAATQMLRLDIVKEVGGYDPSIALEDWYMWLKISEISQIYYMDEVLGCYRRHEGNFSANLEKMMQGRIDVLNCFQDSKYYPKAMERVLWSNARRRIENSSGREKIERYKALFKQKPLKASNLLLTQTIKKIKNK
ncbi:glycosyltransferase family 2 protein [Psychrobacter lutiphocae]|uniref:glycosyltransferase family 2 protein n=1 Tax=Psychrobacter lutiphocae TaxID=540500 RepID=UPI0003694E65|nr:glycosyltransferase [Psychrobacter lutiphocae]